MDYYAETLRYAGMAARSSNRYHTPPPPFRRLSKIAPKRAIRFQQHITAMSNASVTGPSSSSDARFNRAGNRPASRELYSVSRTVVQCDTAISCRFCHVHRQILRVSTAPLRVFGFRTWPVLRVSMGEAPLVKRRRFLAKSIQSFSDMGRGSPASCRDGRFRTGTCVANAGNRQYLHGDVDRGNTRGFVRRNPLSWKVSYISAGDAGPSVCSSCGGR